MLPVLWTGFSEQARAAIEPSPRTSQLGGGIFSLSERVLDLREYKQRAKEMRKLWNFWMDMEQEEWDRWVELDQLLRRRGWISGKTHLWDESFQEFKKHYPAVAKNLEKYRLENPQPTSKKS